jgi:hypothetical protein
MRKSRFIDEQRVATLHDADHRSWQHEGAEGQQIGAVDGAGVRWIGPSSSPRVLTARLAR